MIVKEEFVNPMLLASLLRNRGKIMKFCDSCGSYMEKTTGGFSCPRCGKKSRAKIIEVKDMKNSNHDPVLTVDNSQIEYVKINQTCPRCGNPEAYRRFSSISGDHAGVKQERTIEHFKCTNCQYSWSES